VQPSVAGSVLSLPAPTPVLSQDELQAAELKVVEAELAAERAERAVVAERAASGQSSASSTSIATSNGSVEAATALTALAGAALGVIPMAVDRPGDVKEESK